MPELPEVETVLRGLQPHLEGKPILQVLQNRPDLRYPFPELFVERLEGATIEKMQRRSKYVLFDLNTKETMILHLGMSGRVQLHQENYQAKKHDHLVLRFPGQLVASYNDPRRFGFVDLWPTAELQNHKAFQKLGPEPLGPNFESHYLHQRAKDKKTNLKTFLLDQRVVAGLGNIYVCEILYLSGLNPTDQANTLSKDDCAKIIYNTHVVLNKAIQAGGSTLRDHKKPSGDLGYFQHQFSVYGREAKPCLSCANPIERLVQSGRSTFYCPSCQR